MLFTSTGRLQRSAGLSSSPPTSQLHHDDIPDENSMMLDDLITSNDPSSSPPKSQRPSLCVTTTKISVSHSDALIAYPPHQQPVYLGPSNAKRLMKRATLCKTEYDEPLSIPLSSSSPPSAESLTVKAFIAPFSDPASYSSPPWQNATSSTTHCYSSNTSAQPLGYSVQCLATHAEEERKRKATEHTQREKHALVRYINACRRAEGVPKLRIFPLLAQDAQKFAEKAASISTSTPTSSSSRPPTINTIPSTTTTTTRSSLSTRNTTDSDADDENDNEDASQRVARIESPPGMAALAAAEMWYGGKYRRLQCGTGQAHRPDCPCRLRAAFETLTDPGWTSVGVGWSKDWRWVVELGV